MINRKLTDILPPEKTENKKIKYHNDIKLAGHKKTINKKNLIIFFLVFLFSLMIFCIFSLPKAEIAIWPETEAFNLEKELVLDQNITQLIKKESFLSETFQSTGKIFKEEKAEGTIKIYNEHSEVPQSLVATTRFVSADGKVFRSLERIVVPGATYEKGKLVPSEIEIKVIADEPGLEYNINPTTFSIPGFAGTDKYLKFYAKSFNAMSGGFKEEVANVTKEDLEKAENVLLQKTEQECENILRQEQEKNPAYHSFLDEINVEIIEKFSLSAVDDQKAEFVFQVKANCETLIFEKKYIENYVEKAIAEQFSQEKKIVPDSLEIDYSPSNIDLAVNEVKLLLNSSARVYLEINELAMKNALTNKSLNEVEIFLKNQDNILKTNIMFWPFWVRKVPQDLDKVNLLLRFD